MILYYANKNKGIGALIFLYKHILEKSRTILTNRQNRVKFKYMNSKKNSEFLADTLVREIKEAYIEKMSGVEKVPGTPGTYLFNKIIKAAGLTDFDYEFAEAYKAISGYGTKVNNIFSWFNLNGKWFRERWDKHAKTIHDIHGKGEDTAERYLQYLVNRLPAEKRAANKKTSCHPTAPLAGLCAVASFCAG